MMCVPAMAKPFPYFTPFDPLHLISPYNINPE